MTENKRIIKTKYFYSLGVLLILIDQLSKIWIKGFSLFGIKHIGMTLGDTIPVIGDLVQISYIENAGMAFGITFGSGKILLSLFSIVASVVLIYMISKMEKENIWVRLGFTMIFAGASGNLVDRVFYGVFYGEMPLFYGHVVDFVLVDIPDIDFAGLHYTHFPVFNIADSCVTVGVCILVLAHKHIPDLTKFFRRKKNDEVAEELPSDETE